MNAPNGLLRLLAELATWKVTRFGLDSDGEWDDNRVEADICEGANLVSSKRADGSHAILLDLDQGAYLVPSSTPGHQHLYIPCSVDELDYWALIDILARNRVIEKGYAKNSQKRGATFLRLPWVKKEEVRCAP